MWLRALTKPEVNFLILITTFAGAVPRSIARIDSNR